MATHSLGDFTLLSGKTIRDARLDFLTFGTLSEAKDNVILFPHFLGGGVGAMQQWIGAGRALDSDRYFIVCPGQFGNGVSSGPADGPEPRSQFPQAMFADDVIAQRQLLHEAWGIEDVQLVLGWSTGALQTYDWAVRFGSNVKRIACIAGAPTPSPWTRLWLTSVLAEPLQASPAWNGGDYTSPEAMVPALTQLGHLTALTLAPNWFMRQGLDLWKKIGFDSNESFIQNFWVAFWLQMDPSNVVYQVEKALAADPSQGGDLQAALAGISAKVHVISFVGDSMFNPEDGARYASWTPNATSETIDSEFGHLATFGFSQDDVAKVGASLQTLLAR